MVELELRMRFNQMIFIGRKFGFKEPLNIEINYNFFPFQITVGSAHYTPKRRNQPLGAEDLEMLDTIEELALRTPGSIIARYFHLGGDMQITLGVVRILYPPGLMVDNMEGKLSEKYYSVRARKDDGTYKVVHQL